MTSDPNTPNIFQQSANAYGQGVNMLGAATNPMAPIYSMNMFLNPYRQQVVGDVLGRMFDQRDMDLNMIRGQAAQQRAFGGARHGLVEAELMDRYHRNMGEQAARMMQQGFDTAADFGIQTLGQARLAGQGLVNAAPVGYNMGAATMNQQQQTGDIQRSLVQQMLSQGAGQFDTYANYPAMMANQAMNSIRGNPLSGNTTTRTTTIGEGQSSTSFNPGPLQFLQAGAGIMGGK